LKLFPNLIRDMTELHNVIGDHPDTPPNPSTGDSGHDSNVLKC